MTCAVSAALREGAEAVMALPPYVGHVHKPSLADLIRYYGAIASTGPGPVILQNAPSYFTGLVGIQGLLDIIAAVPRIRYVKEEGPSAAFTMEALARAVAPYAISLIGGAGGLYWPAEAARGAQAWMPACEFGDVLARAVGLWQQGKTSEAEQLYERLLPGLLMEQLMGMIWAKAVLRRRGVLTTVHMRGPSISWGLKEEEDLDRVWPSLAELFGEGKG
jgi:4-hydroxy-tetrahydrodipicolinate synthase